MLWHFLPALDEAGVSYEKKIILPLNLKLNDSRFLKAQHHRETEHPGHAKLTAE